MHVFVTGTKMPLVNTAERLDDRAEIVYGLECKLASSAVTMRPNLVTFRKYDADGVLVSHFR